MRRIINIMTEKRSSEIGLIKVDSSSENLFNELNNFIKNSDDKIIEVIDSSISDIVLTIEWGSTEEGGQKDTVLSFHTNQQLDSDVKFLKIQEVCFCNSIYKNCYFIKIKKNIFNDDLCTFLIYELVRGEVFTKFKTALLQSEELLELITSNNDSLAKLLGLMGELIFLNHIIEEFDNFSKLKDIWFGYTRSSRDFLINKVGVEVKTTTTSFSNHYISSLSQVSPKKYLEGTNNDEKHLFLLSISLIPKFTSSEYTSDELNENLVSINILYKKISEKLKDKFKHEFLELVAQYLGIELQHFEKAMLTNHIYDQRYSIRYIRFYDLLDFENIKIPRLENLIEFNNIDLSSVKFSIFLKEKLSETNPFGIEDYKNKYLEIEP